MASNGPTRRIAISCTDLQLTLIHALRQYSPNWPANRPRSFSADALAKRHGRGLISVYQALRTLEARGDLVYDRSLASPRHCGYKLTAAGHYLLVITERLTNLRAEALATREPPPSREERRAAARWRESA